MDIITRKLDDRPSQAEAEAALVVLRRWADKASSAEISHLDPAVAYLVLGEGYPALNRDYPADFEATEAYKASLPD